MFMFPLKNLARKGLRDNMKGLTVTMAALMSCGPQSDMKSVRGWDKIYDVFEQYLRHETSIDTLQ